ncbi:MAG: hypothetical protein IKR31_05635 [Prevotella sp.]|nr:hypothetical protein [Prevotella sp.]
MNPTMRVVVIKHRSQLLAGSPGGRSVRNVTSSDNIGWQDGGFADDVDDM